MRYSVWRNRGSVIDSNCPLLGNFDPELKVGLKINFQYYFRLNSISCLLITPLGRRSAAEKLFG